jgi:hypothetical protein
VTRDDDDEAVNPTPTNRPGTTLADGSVPPKFPLTNGTTTPALPTLSRRSSSSPELLRSTLVQVRLARLEVVDLRANEDPESASRSRVRPDTRREEERLTSSRSRPRRYFGAVPL